MSKTIRASRASAETRIGAELSLCRGTIHLDSGIGFLDHLLTNLAFHAGWTLKLNCQGDLAVDDHHSVEDCAIVVGAMLKAACAAYEAEGTLPRFGYAFAPLDEALARAVVDISGRPGFSGGLMLSGGKIGDMACENVEHFLKSFAESAGITLHLDVLRGSNDHHKAEAAFKALALALRAATSGVAQGRIEEGDPKSCAENTTSTKGKATLFIEVLDEKGEIA